MRSGWISLGFGAALGWATGLPAPTQVPTEPDLTDSAAFAALAPMRQLEALVHKLGLR